MALLTFWLSLWHQILSRIIRQWDSCPARDSASDSTSPTETQSSQSVNVNIERLLKAKLDLSSTQDEQGFVYVLPAEHNGRAIVKIGHTTETVDGRMKRIRWSCPDIAFRPDSSGHLPHPRIPAYYKLVEKLAQEELQNFRYDSPCSCRKQHREYFTVDPEVARRVVARWIRFCEQRPWQFCGDPQPDCCSCRLKQRWVERLRRWSTTIDAPGSADDLATRLELWDGFVDAGFLAWLLHDVRRGCEALAKYRLEASVVGLFVILASVLESIGRHQSAYGVMSVFAVILFCKVLELLRFEVAAFEHILREWFGFQGLSRR